jgi:hypothetical protein
MTLLGFTQQGLVILDVLTPTYVCPLDLCSHWFFAHSQPTAADTPLSNDL